MLQHIIASALACRLCEANLPHGPKPTFVAAEGARLLIVGQAPGRRVHDTGIPWNDPSGDKLRAWLELEREAFYDRRRIAIIPAGLCYPGTGERGDLPPRPECAPTWHPRFRAALPRIRLTLLLGQYAQAYYLGRRRKKSLAETVGAWRDYAPEFFPLPHPSPRNRLWLKRNPWFERDALPALRQRVGAVLGSE
ncbi:MAG: uracil-DNA glycosylase [Betaproteobacteria bacterium RIFCSPLOWO2_02_FULL_66_14]|nr:MAG: uracil-DNA glycosylase [Betaproteobacteria bacterium RIFCSPLOWO2_02_FULL_66_14]